ncbi:DUF6571 family protein [Streptomyces sp. CBMA156]|uniref:DUF6571 family protein n=1 Tax=Streptomyces sp. CBMA156 TaxID=1930280 RepID=UPI001661F12F|nr:DUF6571 family protein [Streptomyces sp. CBMA156]MBD0673673.1 hypothetical protein [Streptomyces sp. CBMA156]
MLGYEDVLKANPGTLAMAAAKWREMAQKFHTVESDFDQKVLSVTRNGLWTGGTASMANFQLIATKGQITAAQVEANAVASLLDDAKSDFEAAQKQVRAAAEGAVKAGFKVTGTGVAVLDTSTMDKATLDALRHDRETRDAYNEAAAKWTKAIEAGLQAAGDADMRAATALRSASKAGSQDNTFNGQAVGGGDAADAQRAVALVTRLDSLSPEEREQLANLMKANADSPQFSQPLLDKLGPDGMLKLAQQLDDPGKDGGKKSSYPGLRTDLTRALASATQDPGSDFYKKWREGMNGAGGKNFGSNTEPVYGYQILTTMMTKGNAKYSTPFLTDLADDITASEKKHSGKWSYKANHTGSALGADPLDNVLSVMSRQPEAATAYLDPGADGANKRLNYLMKERHWPEGYLTGYTTIKMPDPLAQSGLAAAIEAASTGEPAGSAHDGKHTEAQARVMHDTIRTLDEGQGGDKIKDTLRQPLANALADYVGDTHELLNGRNDVYGAHTGHDSVWKDGDTVRMAVGQDSLVRVMRGLSDDPAAYGALHKAETGQIAQDLAGLGSNPDRDAVKDVMGKGAAALGVYDAIRADAAMDMRDDKNAEADWKAKILYHTIGGPITPIPGVGDAAQRLVDTWTYEVSLNEKDQNNAEANAKISDTYLDGTKEMSDLVGIWARDRGVNPEDHMINGLQDDVLNTRNRSSDVAGRYLGRGNA